ncbi:hypothetical protein J2S40_000310 [Nocardioides luteus]|uniref:DUF4082 domain-containing protein n=1 Tax=Nocardioides luteus TaxID=1844 RepID=A0ABQ5SU37_9ACTN|nr:DUF4082 domain-containing protein [Nocardioides luteus]MDR7309252.1 hypothetical protein [Nocardioides luteus]GGR48772.1 hypothetical protein GCM10010197_13200 [Nocardioides luteus]GLJ67657.1 hypothetical protein GCM10017579_16930 [Nocardioides luteus]
MQTSVSRTFRPALSLRSGRRRLGLLGSALITVVAIAAWVLWPVSQSRADTVSLFPDDAVPAVVTEQDRRPVELGMRFRVTEPVAAVAIQFYKSAANTGPHTGRLWSGSGRELAKARFAGEARRGLQVADLDRQVLLRPGRDYVVSYTAPKGRYSADQNLFARPVSRGPISAGVSAGVYSYRPGTFPTRTFGATSYAVDIVVRPTGSSSPSTSTSPSPSASTSPAPSVSPSQSPSPSAPSSAPSSSAPPATTPPAETDSKLPPTSVPAGFPDAASTGVPEGVRLSPYTGPCTITTAGTVIDGKTVNCALKIRAADVTIRNSVVNGTVYNDEDSDGLGFEIIDSEVRIGNRGGTGISNVGFTVVRVEVTGGNRSINCWRDCTVRDSFVHGQFTDLTGVAHESGIRMGSGGVIRHNTITCDAPDVPPDAGCSAGLTGYGDFAPVRDNLIERNVFLTTTGGACAYGGSSEGKAYPDADHIRFVDNVFQRTAARPNCGYWFPIASFDTSAPGNVWRGNVWSDGGVVPPG